LNTVIIGGGATGLAIAYLLLRQTKRDGVAGNAAGAMPDEVTVLEAGSEAGGLLSTFDAGGGRLERYYHHFFTHDAEINWLMAELGLNDRAIFRPSTMGVLRGGKIYPFNGPRDLLGFNAIGLTARMRFGFSSALLAYQAGYAEREEVPAMEWFRRWAGKAATNAIWAPLMLSKFGDAADRVPLAWMAGRLRQRARSRKGTSEQLGYLRGSLQVLVDRLVEDLRSRGAKIMTNTKVKSLLSHDGAVTGVETEGGIIRADRVVCTTPTPILADLIRPIDLTYADSLQRIEYLGAMCTILALPEQLSPVYWLNVADSGYEFGGVIEQTNLIDPAEYGGRRIVYLSRYLRTDNPLWSMDDQTIVDRQLDQLQRLFGKNLRPTLINSWVFRARYAAALTDLGFYERIPKYRSPVPNLFVAAMPHIYPDERSVNNSIRVAAAVVSTMGIDTSDVPVGASLSAKYGH